MPSTSGQQRTADSRLRKCTPALQEKCKTFPILYENKTEMQPWIYSLYIWGHLWPAVLLNGPRRKTGEIEEIQRTLNCWESFERSSNFRTTQFSKRIKMESQVHFDLENFFHIKILNISWGRWKILTWEFDPGSGWTLAACLTHASRTGLLGDDFGLILIV